MFEGLKPGQYPIIEIFNSIQGEGAQMGRLATFVRFAGCNLACSFCDTKESWKRTNNNLLYVHEIVQRCNEELVVLTGGEPSLQDLKPLVQQLHNKGHFVAIETNGTLPVKDFGIDWVTVSPKEGAQFVLACLDQANEIKYVVDSTFDIKHPNVEYVLRHFNGTVWLQPEGYHMQESWKRCLELARECRDMQAIVRVGVQLHKIMEVK